MLAISDEEAASSLRSLVSEKSVTLCFSIQDAR